jgi:isoleucyl-tRNA synthetase
VRAEPLRFSEQGVRDVVRTVMPPYWNAYSFFTTYAAADGLTVEHLASAPPPAERPEIDRWILSVLQSLVKRVNDEMTGYYLYNVIPPLIEFVDDLTNWYIRRSRRRFWGRHDSGDPASDRDTLAAFATLYEVLVAFSTVMAPVLPFVTEHIYRGLVVAHDPDAPASVHHVDFPDADPALIDTGLEEAMDVVRAVVGLGRGLRRSSDLRVRLPLPALTVVSHDAGLLRRVAEHADLIGDELNVKSVVTSTDETAHAHLSAKPNYRVLGPRLGARMRDVAAAIEGLDEAEIGTLIAGGTIAAAGEAITLGDVVVSREPRAGVVVAAADRLAVALDTTLTPELEREGMARELAKAVQGVRRDAGLEVSDRITLRWDSPSPRVAEAFAAHGEWIAGEALADRLVREEIDAAETIVDGEPVRFEVEAR